MENYLKPDIPATWEAMEKLYESGKARAIGVSNFSCKKLEDLLAVTRVPPAVNQVECHPVWQQHKLRKLCQSKGIHLSVSLVVCFDCLFTIYFPFLLFTLAIIFCRLNYHFLAGICTIRFTWVTRERWTKRP